MNVHFNEDIKPKVLEELSKANKEVIAAIAWFNDKEIYDTLISKAKEGISIDLMISNDPNNFNSPDSLDFEELINAGGKVNRLITDEKLMHHKFCVIDNHTIITGSYNWTYGGSNSNLENIIVVENDIKNCEKFKAEYERMIKTYFKHLDEAVEILEKMKNAISDLQDEIIKNRYLPEKIMENLKKYSGGNFLIESQNTNSESINYNQSKIVNKEEWWDKLPSDVQRVLNDKYINVGKTFTKPSDEAIDYLLSLEELDVSKYRESKTSSRGNTYYNFYFTNCDGLSNLPNLRKINVSGNGIDDKGITEICNLTKLEKLDISDNNISVLPLTNYLPNLQELNISNNKFNSLDFLSNLPSLRIMRANGNSLSGIKGIEKAKKIKYLFIDRNTFELPFITSRLTELGFSERDNDLNSIVKLENEKIL